MSDLIYINNTLVPAGDLKENPSYDESLSFDSSMTVSSGQDIKLTNVDKYNPHKAGSLFYGIDPIGKPVSIYNTDLGVYTFRGKIKNLKVSSECVTLSVISNISDLSEVTAICKYEHITPAEAIYNLLITDNSEAVASVAPTLTDVQRLVNPMIPEDQIIYSGFARSIEIQKQNLCYVDITCMDSESNSTSTSVADVIGNLLKIGRCMFFTYNNLVCLVQYPYPTSALLSISKIKAGSLSTYYAEGEEYGRINSYRVVYSTGPTSVNWITGSNNASIKEYGLRRFTLDDDEESSSSEDYSCIIDNPSGARWVGDTVLEQRETVPEMCDFTAEYDKYFTLKIGDVVALDVDPFSNTNVLLIGRDANYSDNEIKFKGMFL